MNKCENCGWDEIICDSCHSRNGLRGWVNLNDEELEWMMRFCQRSIQLASHLGDKAGTIFDPERGENIEKATKLFNKLKKSHDKFNKDSNE